jgi:hypothetical protein
MLRGAARLPRQNHQYDEEFSSALYPAGSHDRLEIPFYRVMGSLHESCTFNMVRSENLA